MPTTPLFMGAPDAQELAEQEVARQEAEAFEAGRPPLDIFAILDGDEDLAPAPEQMQEAAARLQADRYLRALAGAERHLAAMQEELRAYHAMLDDRHVERSAPVVKGIAWLTAQLQSVFRFIPTHGKAKSVKLLAGTLGTRHHNAHLKVLDSAAVLAWAKTQTEGAGAGLVRTVTVEKPDHDALETYALATGEVPPGCELVPEGDTFYAKAEGLA